MNVHFVDGAQESDITDYNMENVLVSLLLEFHEKIKPCMLSNHQDNNRFVVHASVIK